MAIRVLEDGRIEATPASGGAPVVFDPQSASLLGIGPPPELEPGDPAPEEPARDESAPRDAAGAAAQALSSVPSGFAPADDGGDFSADDPGAFVVPSPPVADLSALAFTPEEQAQALALAGGAAQPAEAASLPATLGYADRVELAAQEGAQAALGATPAPSTGDEDTDVAYLDGERRIAASAYGLKEANEIHAEARAEATRLMQEVEAQRSLTQERQAVELQARADEATKEFADIRAEKEALSKAEPNQARWWSSRSTMQKVAAYVGAIIRGVMHPGEPNTFVDAVLQQIDRDVALQERQIQRELDVLEQNAQSLGQEFDRDVAAMKLRFGLEAEKFESVKRFIELAMSNEDFRLAATRANAEIERQEGLRQQAGALKTAERRTEKQIREHKQRLERLERQAKIADANRKAKLGPRVNDLNEPRGELSIPFLYDKKTGAQIAFRNGLRASEVGELRKQQAAAHKASGILTAILEEGPDSVIFNPRDDQKLIQENLVQQLHAAMRVALAGGGVTSDKDMALIQEIIPDPGAWLRAANWKTRRKQLKNLLAGVNAGVNAGLLSQGVGDAEFRATPMGVEHYKAQLRGDEKPDDNIRVRNVPTVPAKEIEKMAIQIVSDRLGKPVNNYHPEVKELYQQKLKEIRGQEARRRTLYKREPQKEAKQAKIDKYAAEMERLAGAVYGENPPTDDEIKDFVKNVRELEALGYDVPEDYLRDANALSN